MKNAGSVTGRVMRSVGIAFVAALALTVSAAVPAGAVVTVDYSGFMHDNAHSSYSASATTITPSSSLSLKWTFQETKPKGGLNPGFYATPLVISHVMYASSNSGEVYAIDIGTGNVLWRKFVGFEARAKCRAQGVYATSAFGNDPTTGAPTLYVASGDGNIYALRASDGTTLWKSPVNVPDPGTNDRFDYSSPTLANGKIYIGMSSECDNDASPVTIRGGVVSIDQATGNKLATWYSVPVGQLGGSVWSTPAIGPDGSVFVTTGDSVTALVAGDSQSIVRLDPNTLTRLDGYELITGKSDTDFGASPTLFTATIGGTSTQMVGACNKNGFYYAWRANSLSSGWVWRYKATRHQGNTGECDGGGVWDGSSLYVPGARTIIGGTSYRGSMAKLNPATGAVIWATGLPEAIRTYPSLDGAGALVAASFDTTNSTNSAFLINASTGTYRTIDDGNTLSVSAPVFADQYLVIANLAGTIYTYQTP
jgi:polyvinyl alcohol dehydrogenase (cytochrome)